MVVLPFKRSQFNTEVITDLLHHLFENIQRLTGKDPFSVFGNKDQVRVNASGLAKTNMAKSVLDAGWSMFRTQLQYKGDSAGSWVREVNEAYSTQECSCCHARTGPKGLKGLGVRLWTCSVCQSEHDRDTNAAKNILARGLVELEREFATAGEAKAAEAAVNKDGKPSQVGQDLPVAGIIAPLGR